MSDFQVQDEGTLTVLYPRTDAARQWLAEHVLEEDTQRWAGGVVIEHRYVRDILDAVDRDGFCVEVI
jgi:hypothetical protein